jgi:hypothetical protein
VIVESPSLTVGRLDVPFPLTISYRKNTKFKILNSQILIRARFNAASCSSAGSFNRSETLDTDGGRTLSIGARTAWFPGSTICICRSSADWVGEAAEACGEGEATGAAGREGGLIFAFGATPGLTGNMQGAIAQAIRSIQTIGELWVGTMEIEVVNRERKAV